MPTSPLRSVSHWADVGIGPYNTDFKENNRYGTVQ